jgi:hypothetical protein
MVLQKFDLPSRKTWLRVFALIFINSIIGFLAFIFLCIKKSFGLIPWVTNQLIEFGKKQAFLIKNLPYGGVVIPEQERIGDFVAGEEDWGVSTPKLFDFQQLKENPDLFPHIRIIGKTGVGKTTLAQYLLSVLGGEQFVITPKKKPTDWQGYQVFGYPFNYVEIEEKLKGIHSLMYSRYKDIHEGFSPSIINFVLDEWRLIHQNVETAKDLMRDIINVARDARIRLIALAPGERVKTWGLEGEGDLEDCFTTIRLGEFALDYCKRQQNRYHKGTEDYEYYLEVLQELKKQGRRCCMVENNPAIVPDLSYLKQISHTPYPDSTNLFDSLISLSQTQLNKYEQSILKWGQNNVGRILTARDAQSNINVFKSVPAEDIRSLFHTLANKNFGTIIEANQKLAWVYY